MKTLFYMFIIGSILLYASISFSAPSSLYSGQSYKLLLPFQNIFTFYNGQNYHLTDLLVQEYTNSSKRFDCNHLHDFLNLVKENPDLYFSQNTEASTLVLFDESFRYYKDSSVCPVIIDACLFLRWLSPRVDLISESCNYHLKNLNNELVSGAYVDSLTHPVRLIEIKSPDKTLLILYNSYLNNPFDPDVLRGLILSLLSAGFTNEAQSLMSELYQIDSAGLWLTRDFYEVQQLVDLVLRQPHDSP